jgi:hypothetical protein
MTLKQLILGVLTVLAIGIFGLSLVESWQKPQIQSRLELYQTNLILNAAQWQPSPATTGIASLRDLLGTSPFKAALETYQEAHQQNQKLLEQTRADLQQVQSGEEGTIKVPVLNLKLRVTLNEKARQSRQTELEKTLQKLQQHAQPLDLRLGLLQAQQQQTQAAQMTWQSLSQPSPQSDVATTAQALKGLWSSPPQLLPDAEEQIQAHLHGWFRYYALTQLYQLQDRTDVLQMLQVTQQRIAQQAFLKLMLLAVAPILGVLLGIGLLIVVFVQRWLKGKQSWLAQNNDVPWSVPWSGEIVWQVLILTFFVISQIVIPLIFGVLQINTTSTNQRSQAVLILANYGLFSLGGIGVLYASIRSFLPLPSGWFRWDWRGSWFTWGVGGYFVALPLVVLISQLNEQIWQGRGGNNPILPIALGGQDGLALACFFITAGILAPLFEEVIFRGFLLPSLTRYLSVGEAIIVSSLLFAIAHLSLSEILPLTVLGIVLGVVYTRSRNLLSAILLHSLWNSATLLGLFILASEAQVS